MAWTESDVLKLEAAIASGVQTVTFDGPPRRSVTYQTTSEMVKALALMRASIAQAAGKSSVGFASTKKGF